MLIVVAAPAAGIGMRGSITNKKVHPAAHVPSMKISTTQILTARILDSIPEDFHSIDLKIRLESRQS
jgi:hypothetical protein